MVDNPKNCVYTPPVATLQGERQTKSRAVAQSGSALAWGARGRGFESRLPDKQKRSAMVTTAAEPFCFVYPNAGFEHATPQQRGIRLRLFHRLRRDRVGGECRWHEPTLRRRDTSRREACQGRRGRVESRLPDEIKTLSNGSTAAERFAFVLFNALMGGGTEVPCSDKFYFRVQKRACHSSGKDVLDVLLSTSYVFWAY